MELEIKINMDNAAFEEIPSFEVARILRALADRIDGHPHFSPGHFQSLFDINGNTVGHATIND